MLRIEKALIAALGGEVQFANDVTAYRLALAAHALTVGVPAPMPPNSTVATCVRDHASQYEIYESDGTVPLPPEDPRVIAFKAEQERTDLLTRLKTATPAEIDAWFTANVTTLLQARNVMRAIVKLLVTNLNLNK